MATCECGERALSKSEQEADRCRICDKDAESRAMLRQASLGIAAIKKAKNVRVHSCANCKFWAIGFCHRYPPTLDSNLVTHHPKTRGETWCGEHQPKEAQDE